MHRVGIYGIEGHEELILESVAERGDAVLVAVASENPERFEGVKGHKAVTAETKFHGDWREMLEKEEITALGVCSETDRHVEPILAAAERGIHVMSEKPVSVDRRGLEEVRAAVERSGIHFSVLLSMRTDPAYAGMREVVRSGEIGKPVLIFGQKSYRLGERPEWMQRRASFGGSIPYVGSHMLDLAMWITGLGVKRVTAVHGNAGKPEVREMEDHGAVIFEMSRGAAMALTVDYLRPAAAATHGDDRLRVAGSTGVVEVRSAETFRELVTTGEGPREFSTLEKANLFSDFLDAIDGECRHMIQPEEIWRVMEILLAAVEAADSGRSVKV
ncbi:MAG: Gfo/Idh/MocA family protein [Planctomycetota bacterium]|jgi:predicted dehydrogenase